MAYLGNFTLSFKNEHIIEENEVRCLVEESDFNLSYNPTIVTGSYIGGVVRNFATSSDSFLAVPSRSTKVPYAPPAATTTAPSSFTSGAKDSIGSSFFLLISKPSSQ